jgi:tetratricopeptide (TPR) repeat protein
MCTLTTSRSIPVALLLTLLFVLTAGADDLKEDTTWRDVTSKGETVVFGRLEGRFDGPEFHNRKLELHKMENGKKYSITIHEGLGYFEAVMQEGTYQVTAVEATYYPPERNLNPERYRPVRQRFGVRPKPSEGGIPSIKVGSERPIYIGTLQVDNRPDGMVYRGHYIQIVDEFDETYERLEANYPAFVTSLADSQITPARHYMLKPLHRESPLEIVEVEDPIRRAREYISEYRFEQAINWLQTFMPASDHERTEMRLLIGEAYLGDGKLPEAISKLGDALEAEPENLRALRLLARAHLFNEDDDDALNLYEALAENLPGDAEAHLQLGYLYALREDSSRSAVEFNSAFTFTLDYLLHDISPFAAALRAVREDSLEYDPPRVTRQRVRPPSFQSRRGSNSGGIALVIDHNGKVVAARVSPGTTGGMSLMLVSMLHATFKPAKLNGIPVPSVLLLGGGPGGKSSQ